MTFTLGRGIHILRHILELFLAALYETKTTTSRTSNTTIGLDKKSNGVSHLRPFVDATGKPKSLLWFLVASPLAKS